MTGMELLRALEGRWLGTGRGAFPTIKPFEYAEETTFTLAAEYPLMRYEQRTLLLPERKPSHWELGFIRPVDDDLLEVSNAQDGGRVEVLRGGCSVPEDDPAGFRLSLRSKSFGNDPRMIATERVITLRGDELHYQQHMVTTTTERPARQMHLEAWLRRAGADR